MSVLVGDTILSIQAVRLRVLATQVRETRQNTLLRQLSSHRVRLRVVVGRTAGHRAFRKHNPRYFPGMRERQHKKLDHQAVAAGQLK